METKDICLTDKYSFIRPNTDSYGKRDSYGRFVCMGYGQVFRALMASVPVNYLSRRHNHGNSEAEGEMEGNYSEGDLNSIETVSVDSGNNDNVAIRPIASAPTVNGRNGKEKRTRKPFHYNAPNPGPTRNLEGILTPANEYEAATYNRFKYYSRLRGTAPDDSALLIPDHVLPPVFFYPYIPGRSLSGKQGSIVTIFAIWNTMMGTSLLSMPWAIERSGFVMGLFLMALMAGICLYTAYRILTLYSIYGEKEQLSDFPDLCRFLLGKWSEWVAVIFSALALIGAAIVYWVLMSNFLYNSVRYIYGLVEGNANQTDPATNTSYGVVCLPTPVNLTTQEWEVIDEHEETSYFDEFWSLGLTVPLYLAVVLGPLLCLKSATFFTKFNALGTCSVFYIVAFVITQASNWGIHANFSDMTSEFFVSLIQPNFPALSGMLSLALFLHNCVITIMKNNRNQEKNARDLSIAYGLVTMTYMLIGTLFFLAFPLRKSCIEDNFLNNFVATDVWAAVARMFLLFQMSTVFPLLAYILRAQLFYAFYRSVYPSFGHILLFNVGLLSVCILFAIFLPQVGTIIRFSGALCGLVYIFSLPNLLYMMSLKREGRLTWTQMGFHSLILLAGMLNFVAQFLVTD